MMNQTDVQTLQQRARQLGRAVDRTGGDRRSSGCGAGSGAAWLAGRRRRGGLCWHRRLCFFLRSNGDHFPVDTEKGAKVD